MNLSATHGALFGVWPVCPRTSRDAAAAEFAALVALAGLGGEASVGGGEFLTHDEHEEREQARILEEEGDALAALGF